MVDIKKPPYFSAYDEAKKYYRILARPGRPIQVREWNDLQEQIQKQIERIGAHLFENGAQILPGSKEGVKYVNNIGWIKIPRTANADTEAALKNLWLGKTIISTSGNLGIKAQVIGFKVPDESNEARLFLNYLNADASGVYTAFSEGQVVTTQETSPISATIVANYGVGQISSVIVEEGVYFYNGNFILVDQQQIFIEPENPLDQTAWINRPAALVALRVTESIVTAEDDPTLFDNASGTPNFSAPGADRLAITATLIQTNLDNTDPNLIPLLKVVDGTVQQRVVRTDYSVIEDTLARRTFDESGDYCINPFTISIQNFLRIGNNEGVHVEKEFYFETSEAAKEASKRLFNFPDPGESCNHPNVPGFFLPASSYSRFLQLCNDRLSIRVGPGKAYVKGYEIEKIFTNTIDIERARTLKYRNNKSVFTPLGTFLYVTNLFGTPKIEDYDLIEIHSKFVTTNGVSPASKIGTARALALEFFSGVNGSSTGVYRLFLFDIQADDGKDLTQAKSLYSGSPTFTCNIEPEFFRLNGSITTTNIGGVAAGANTLLGIGTSWKNDQTQVLKKGDYIRVGQGEQARLYSITEDPDTDNSLTVAPNPATDGHTWPDGATVDYVFATVKGTSETPSLLYKLPDEIVYTIRGGEQGEVNPAIIDTSYVSRRVILDGTPPNSTANGLGKLTATIGADEEFQTFSASDYVVIDQDTGDYLEVLPYVSGNPTTGKCEIQPVGSQLTIHCNAALAGHNFYVIASIRRNGNSAGQERAKTLVSGIFSGGVGSFYSGPYAESNGADVNVISLGKADVVRVTRIVESPNYNTTPSNLETLPDGHKDITGAYILDNGQRDYYYDIARITLKAGAIRPKGRVRVEFEYFTHGNTGNYFSVDSYPFKGSNPQMRYEDIPLYNSPNGGQYDLASCLDFRPRVSEPGGIGDGFSTSIEPPKDSVRCDYHFFEARIDKLYLDRSGKFGIKKGVPDITPVTPGEPDTGMTLYKLYLRPYTANPSDCVPELIDNRRYTMRDIGKLEKRIKNLEDYTSLSLLEKETSDLLIPDATGKNKFKNGFMVDNFSGFKLCDLGSLDFRAAVDTASRELRPMAYRDNVRMFELNLLEPNEVTRQSNRAANHYQKTGDIYTLPYTDTVLVEQTKASKVSNVNPYAVFTYVGVLDIKPWSDEWKEADQWAPPLNVVDDSEFQAVNRSFGPPGTSISWGATLNNWTGIDINKTNTGREKLITAGHADVARVRKIAEEKTRDNKNENRNNPEQGKKGSSGSSTIRGPGKPAQNSSSKGGRQQVGGHRGGKNRK